MASLLQNVAEAEVEAEKEDEAQMVASSKLLSSCIGLGFAFFLASLPKSSVSLIPNLHARAAQAEEQIQQMRSRRKEDAKANARVVEIFASHRNAWQREERRLLDQIDASAEEIAHLRAKLDDLEKSEADLKAHVAGLRREVGKRDEMRYWKGRDFEEGDGSGAYACTAESGGDAFSDALRFGKIGASQRLDSVAEECFLERDRNAEEIAVLCGQNGCFGPDFVPSASKLWAERAGIWEQDLQFESLESQYHAKHFVVRRESPWKVDGDSTGVASKLNLLEQELLNLERIGKSDVSKVSSLMRRQAKTYQALSEKIDDLCRRMQVSDPCESTLGPEFRTRRQIEFLLEAFRLQQRASETGQKLMALRTETAKSYVWGDELGNQAELTTTRSLNSIRNNFKEIQRNLEIWLARIIGDLEGILARDGAFRAREYYMSKLPFVQ